MLGCVLLLMQAVAAADERVVLQLDISQPRSFGYHIGDRLAREITLKLRQPYQLNQKALPAAGRWSEFLSLEAPTVTSAPCDNATCYSLRFDYQVVNVGSEAQSVAVPDHTLEYSDGKETLKALIPATRISVTPLRGRDETTLESAEMPRPLPFKATTLWLCAGVFALSLVGLVTLYAGLPRWRAARPFALAERALRDAARRGWHDADYELALRAVHRAFNDTAGRTVFADALASFFAEHRAFASVATPVTEFYTRSRAHFFAAPNTPPAPRYSAQELIRLVKRCRDIERGLA